MRIAIHAVTALALLSVSLSSAWAQQVMPAMQAMQATPASAASAPKPLSPPPPPPLIINRWVDAHGRVHYGDALPPDAAEKTTQITPVQNSTPEQKAQADAQMQKYRDYLKQPAAAPQAAASQIAVPPQPLQDDSCAGQWARFNAAAACANQYRVVGGGLKADVAQHCPVVPQPTCQPPSP